MFFLYENTLSKQRKYWVLHIILIIMVQVASNGFQQAFSVTLHRVTLWFLITYALIISSQTLILQALTSYVVCFIMQCVCHFRFLMDNICLYPQFHQYWTDLTLVL